MAAMSTRQPAAMNPLKNEKSFWDASAQPDKPKKINAVPPRAVRTISLPDWLDNRYPIRGPMP